VNAVVPTAELAALVYGEDGVAPDDPAEAFHEASRLHPRIAPGRLPALLALGRSSDLQQTVARSSRTFAHRPTLRLPRGSLPELSLADALQLRRSSLAAERRPLVLPSLAAVLETAYAATPRPTEGLRRPVPSGGALYPLELYVLALAVDGCDAGVLHYNPFSHGLEQLRALDEAAARDAIVDGGLVDRAAAVLVVTAMFWRSRFKYGLRGYRFALLEAGHVVQNVMLAAAALGLPGLPVGGFYDRRLDGLVGADGLDEACVYAVALGGDP